MQNEYDIKKVMEEIELQLIASMKRTLWGHREDEKTKGFNWPQWQAIKIKQFEDYKKANKEIFDNNTKNLNRYVYKQIKQQFKEGASRTNKNAIKTGFIKKEDSQLGGSFFGLNHRKLDALIKSTKSDMSDVKYATLRMANDQYRQIIYKAQVFANTGAGTVKQAIDMASKDFLARGFNCIEYKNGTRHNIADYCDMAIRTANKRANLMGEGEIRKKLGNPLVYISKHGGACDKCTPWEGRVYIDDVWSGGKEDDGEYPLLSTAIAGGLFHPRCQHGASTYYEGINNEPEEVTKAKHNHSENDKYTLYLQQRQKQYERLASGSLLPENIEKYQNEANKLQNQVKNSKIKKGILEERLGKEHTDKIIETISKAPNNIQKVWNNFIDKININDINYKKTAIYSWNENGIYIDLDKISKDRIDEFIGKNEKEVYRKAYGTLYHETGHHISAIFSRKNQKNIDVAEWFESKKYFKEQFVKDGSKIKIGQTLDEMVRKEGWEYIDNVLKEMREEAKNKGLKASSVNSMQVYQKISQDLRSMSLLEQQDISDMFDGITNGKAFGYTQHSYSTKDYWKKHKVGTEAFAEMFDATINNPESLKKIKEYFPKSYEIFEEIIKEMGE